MTGLRTILTASFLAPLAFAIGRARRSAPVIEFLTIEQELNAGAASEEEYIAAFERLYAWQPDTAAGFLRKFNALMGEPENDGWPPRDRMMIFVRDARRLGKREARP